MDWHDDDGLMRGVMRRESMPAREMPSWQFASCFFGLVVVRTFWFMIPDTTFAFLLGSFIALLQLTLAFVVNGKGLYFFCCVI